MKTSSLLRYSGAFIIILMMLSTLVIRPQYSYGQVLMAPAGQGQPQYTGHENHSISLADAIRFTKNYRDTMPAGSLLAEYFGKDAIQSILSQSGCVGLRIYNGKNDAGSVVFVLVGVDSRGQDLTSGPLGEWGFPCPPFCDTAKVLGH